MSEFHRNTEPAIQMFRRIVQVACTSTHVTEPVHSCTQFRSVFLCNSDTHTRATQPQHIAFLNVKLRGGARERSLSFIFVLIFINLAIICSAMRYRLASIGAPPPCSSGSARPSRVVYATKRSRQRSHGGVSARRPVAGDSLEPSLGRRVFVDGRG